METYGVAKNTKVSTILIGIFLFIWFGLPAISIFGIIWGPTGSIIGIFIVLFFIKIILTKIKNIKVPLTSFDMKLVDDTGYSKSENKINIPSEFYNSGKNVYDVSKYTQGLFNSRNGRKIIYYENGNPVYEK